MAIQADEEHYTVPVFSLVKIEDDQAKVTVDGILDEAIWQDIQAFDRMRVITPDTLEPGPYRTQIKIFYTSEGMYAGIFAEQPKDTLIGRLSSRDRFITRDFTSVNIDPSGQGLYGYWYSVNLGGTLSDGTTLPERQFNNQWDGPWRGAQSETEDGWYSEYFMPWSMMTMPDIEGDTRTIGIYFGRRIAHKNELWGWPALPDTGSRFISGMQKVEIDNITPQKQFTFYPYASTSYNVIDAEDDYKSGFDLFWRPSSNLQVSATVNPDFGNVESDDVVVNLTSLETFFPEKRPFFLEGQEIFNTSPRARKRGTPTILVNTRRIGSSPKGLDIPDLDLTDLEANQPTELQGAAKVTGQKGNWRYGVLTAIEDDTKIEGTVDGLDVDHLQDGRNFGAARLLYESTSGNSRTGLGWITTAVNHPDADAIVHGIDGHVLSESGQWKLDGQLLYSDVADVSGKGGYVDIKYTPKKGIKHSVEFDYFDDNLELNDFGFLRRNDQIGARYRLEVTQSDLDWAKSRESSLFLNQEYNTDGRVVRSGIFLNQKYRFNNNHFLFTELNYFPSRWDDLNSAGNGDYRIDGRIKTGAFWSSDGSKTWQHQIGLSYEDEQIGGRFHVAKYEVTWRPSDRFSVQLRLEYKNRNGWLIHNSGRDFTTYEAEFWQTKLDIDYFLSAKQQFRISAQWIGVKAFERARWQVPIGDGALTKDPRAVTDSRNFSIGALVFQARYRWEIAPLSDLFVVYTRGSDLPSMPDDDFGDLLHDSWTNRAVDLFVIKLRYRLGS